MGRSPGELNKAMREGSYIKGVGYSIILLASLALQQIYKHPRPRVDPTECMVGAPGNQRPCSDSDRIQMGAPPVHKESDDNIALCYVGIIIGFCIGVGGDSQSLRARKELRSLEFELLDGAYQNRMGAKSSAPIGSGGSCKHCGASYLPDQEFCGKCGKPLIAR